MAAIAKDQDDRRAGMIVIFFISTLAGMIAYAHMTAPKAPQVQATQPELAPTMEVYPGQFFADNRAHRVVLVCPDPDTVKAFRHLAETNPRYLDSAGAVAIGAHICHFQVARPYDRRAVIAADD